MATMVMTMTAMTAKEMIGSGVSYWTRRDADADAMENGAKGSGGVDVYVDLGVG